MANEGTVRYCSQPAVNYAIAQCTVWGSTTIQQGAILTVFPIGSETADDAFRSIQKFQEGYGGFPTAVCLTADCQRIVHTMPGRNCEVPETPDELDNAIARG